MAWLERLDGCRLYYELHGPSGATPLVLLEGMGGDVPGWRRNIPALSAEHRVVAFDFRGNGRSDMPDEPVTMATFVDDTVALLDELGFERAHAYGMSFGGMAGLELALTHPARVRSLVLAATHAGQSHRASLPEGAHVPKDRPFLALYSAGFARDHPDRIAEDIVTGSRNRQPAHTRRRQWETVQAWDAWERLGSVACPVLVLHGTEDRLVAPENARMLAERIPGAQLVLLEGAGHVYHAEQPEAADEAVLVFLRRVDGRSP